MLPGAKTHYPSYRHAIRDSRIATYFVEECLETRHGAQALTRTGKLLSTEARHSPRRDVQEWGRVFTFHIHPRSLCARRKSFSESRRALALLS